MQSHLLNRSLKKLILSMGICASLLGAHSASATIVQFQTVMGDFSVNLYDKTTPKTVENFLAYVKAGAYTNSIIHRSATNFVVQGGGYKYDGKMPLVTIPQNAAVTNEPVYANKRGTIAMAKLGSDANSATNQWFFNLKDNSANLDAQNGGFTVFGEVTGNGMGVVDSIAALSIFNMGSPLDSLPLRKYTSTDAANNVVVTDANLVMILGVVVLDANVDTAVNLTPPKTTNNPKDPNNSGGGGGGGGSIGWLGLLLISLVGLSRRFTRLR